MKLNILPLGLATFLRIRFKQGCMDPDPVLLLTMISGSGFLFLEGPIRSGFFLEVLIRSSLFLKAGSGSTPPGSENMHGYMLLIVYQIYIEFYIEIRKIFEYPLKHNGFRCHGISPIHEMVVFRFSYFDASYESYYCY